MRVFYDDYEKAQLWGKDLYEHLDYVYRRAARYCLVFVSKNYAEKLWTSHERRSAQARAFEENREYVLPARFDDTEVPGLRSTVGYISLRHTSPEELAELVKKKLGPRQRDHFFPPSPDALFDEIDVTDEDERQVVAAVAYRFFEALQRMTPDERRVIQAVLIGGCPAELPENVHISLDLLRREARMPASEVLEILAAIRSLGFRTRLREPGDLEDHDLAGDDKMVVLSWSHLTDVPYDESTQVAHDAWAAAQHYCEHHGVEAFVRLDFSALASATVEEHKH
ncbi:MAG: TIR domain-containing protein [Actinomycetota bacterium]|nr:TIR domain-containing protein [Actinomycetota bacterium]